MPAADQAYRNFQGIIVPESAVQPQEFFRATRRQTFQIAAPVFPGFGQPLNISMLQVGIIAGLSIKFSGTLTTTVGTGAVATTFRWPYDLLKAIRFSANAQANLINASGSMLKARDFMVRSDANDRGVARGIGGTGAGTSRTQGTLSLNTENWGVGQNTTAITDAAYPVELNWFVPIAHDQQNLLGAIFAQTSSTDLLLSLDVSPQAELFTLTGTATAVLTGSFVIEAIVFSIPQGPDGGIIVPDLSAFHSIIQATNRSIGNGENETRLAGQGVGRQLTRLWFRTLSGTVPAPLAMNATNYGRIAWRFGGNETPEVWTDGRHLAQVNERLFGIDFATYAGIGIWDWDSEFAFRDSIDEGSATELRLVTEIPSGVSLTSAFVEYVQETIFAGAVGA